MCASIRAFDGRAEQTQLSSDVMKALDLSHMNDIVHRIYHIDISRSEVAALAPMVISAARNGDQGASPIIKLGIQEQVLAVHVAAAKLNLLTKPEIVLVGRLQNATDGFVEPLRHAISDDLPGSVVRTPELSPVLGACVLALKQRNVDLNAVATRLRDSETLLGE